MSVVGDAAPPHAPLGRAPRALSTGASLGVLATGLSDAREARVARAPFHLQGGPCMGRPCRLCRVRQELARGCSTRRSSDATREGVGGSSSTPPCMCLSMCRYFLRPSRTHALGRAASASRNNAFIQKAPGAPHLDLRLQPRLTASWLGPDVSGVNLFFFSCSEPDARRGTDRGRAVRPHRAPHAWLDGAHQALAASNGYGFTI